MKMIKRTFTLVLTLAVLLVGFTFPEIQGEAKAETSAPSGISGTNDVGIQPDELLQSGEWLYYLYGNEAIIAGYKNQDETSLVIPFYLNKHHVSGINQGAFQEMHSLRTITIHSLVTRIPQNVFNGMDITIIAYSGSYALEYAEENGIKSRNRTNENKTYDFNSSVLADTGIYYRDDLRAAPVILGEQEIIAQMELFGSLRKERYRPVFLAACRYRRVMLRIDNTFLRL